MKNESGSNEVHTVKNWYIGCNFYGEYLKALPDKNNHDII